MNTFKDLFMREIVINIVIPQCGVHSHVVHYCWSLGLSRKLLQNDNSIVTISFFANVPHDNRTEIYTRTIDTLMSRMDAPLVSIHSMATCFGEFIARGKSGWRLFTTAQCLWKVVEECMMTLIIRDIRLHRDVTSSLVPPHCRFSFESLSLCICQGKLVLNAKGLDAKGHVECINVYLRIVNTV